MPPHPDDPLIKCTLNLYADDVKYLRFAYGHGWSEQVRRVVRDYVSHREQLSDEMRGVK